MSWFLPLVFLSIFIYISYRRVLWGAALVVALLPTYLWRFSLVGLPITFLELMIASLFIVWLLQGKKYKNINWRLEPIYKNKISVIWRYLLAAWLLSSLLALALNPLWSSWGLWRAYFLEPLLFFIVLIYELRDEHSQKLIIRALAGLLTGLFLITLYQFFTSWNLPAAYDWPQIRRLTAVFSYPNALALLTAAPGAFFLGLGLSTLDRAKISGTPFLFVMAALMVLGARSDGAIVGLLISILFYLILALLNNAYLVGLAKNLRKWVLSGILLLVFFSIISGFPFKYLREFKQQLFNPQLDLTATSLEIRSSQWRETINFLQDHFWLGAGLNAYQTALKPYHQVDWLEIYLYPHNIFLNFWVELGLIGLLVFIFILIKLTHSLFILYQRSDSWFWPLTMFWLTWFIPGLVDVPYFKNDLSVLFFIFLALTISRENQVKVAL